MYVLTVMNNKGGEAKTTTAHSLLCGLVDRGYKALAIDLDPQANLTYTLRAKSSRTIQGVLVGELEAKEAVQTLERGSIIQSSQALAVIDNVLDSMEIYQGRTSLLRKAIKPLANDYDYVIIDTPPSLSTLTVNALVASNYVIVPSQADIYSLQGLTKISETVKKLNGSLNPELRILGILLTRYSNKSVLSKDLFNIFEGKAREYNTRIFLATIREAIAIREAHARQTDIFCYAPKSKVAGDYGAFVDEVIKEIEG